MKLALVQMQIQDGLPRANWNHAKKMIESAPKADLYLLPELWSTGYLYSSWQSAADFHQKELLSELKAYAISKNVWLAGSLVCRKSNGRLANRFWLFSPDGSDPSWYDKGHLFAPMNEDRYMEAGETRCRRQVNGMIAAFSVCFDLRFPEMYRLDAVDGAGLFLVASEWPHERCSVMRSLAQARAIENQAFLALCNRVGKASDGTVFCGNSAVWSPDGALRADAGEQEGVVTAEIDESLIEKARSVIGVLQSRKPGLDWKETYPVRNELFKKYRSLAGERIDLIPLSLEYTDDVFEYSQFPEFFEFLTSKPAKQRGDVEIFLKNLMADNAMGRRLYFMIKHKQDNKVIGTIGLTEIDFHNLRTQMGFGISPAYWGKGYFQEALSLLLSFVFDDLSFYRVEVGTLADNLTSIKSVKKAGFVQEGVFKEMYRVSEDLRMDTVFLALTAREWRKRKMSDSPTFSSVENK